MLVFSLSLGLEGGSKWSLDSYRTEETCLNTNMIKEDVSFDLEGLGTFSLLMREYDTWHCGKTLV